MAWGGKYAGRMSEKARKHFLRTSHRKLPQPDLPPGGLVPRSVMRGLQWRQLPFDKRAYEQGLRELLTAYELNGG
jgi:hypothetical protein